MRFSRRRPFAIATLLGAIATAAASDSPSLEAIATVQVDRLEASLRIEVVDGDELAKLGREASLVYKLLRGKTTVSYASPDKLALKNRILHAVVNGRRHYLHAPPLVNRRKTESEDPMSRRFSLLNVGILVRSGLDESKSRHIRSETLGGRPCEVYEVNYDWDSAANYVFWVDAERRLLLRREWRTKEGELKAAFVVTKSAEASRGLWAPSEIEVRTDQGALAARILVDALQVNPAQAEAVFEIP